ncbi:MAG: sulfite exporter TauE/SafE family protein [Porticoccaceae bacterium]
MEYLLIYMGIGALAGVFAGLLGVGGGAVTVPLLLWVFASQGISPEIATHMALATSLAAMIVTSISSALAHSAKKAVMWNIFPFLAAGVILGSVFGVMTAINISGAVLQIGFGCFLTYVALQTIIGFSAKASRSLPGKTGLASAGGIIGCVSMYFGIGGGSLTVPFLSYCGVPPGKAVGTSAALGLPIALWGTTLYIVNGWQNALMPEYSLGFVYGPAAAGIVLTSPFFAKLGAIIAHRLKPDHLRKVFGVVLMVIAVELLWNNLL